MHQNDVKPQRHDRVKSSDDPTSYIRHLSIVKALRVRVKWVFILVKPSRLSVWMKKLGHGEHVNNEIGTETGSGWLVVGYTPYPVRTKARDTTDPWGSTAIRPSVLEKEFLDHPWNFPFPKFSLQMKFKYFILTLCYHLKFRLKIKKYLLKFGQKRFAPNLKVLATPMIST